MCSAPSWERREIKGECFYEWTRKPVQLGKINGDIITIAMRLLSAGYTTRKNTVHHQYHHIC